MSSRPPPKPPEYTGRQFISGNIKIVPARCHLVLDGLIRCVHGCPMSAISEHSCYQPVPILRGFLEKKTFLLFFTRIYRRAVEKISSIFPIKAIDASPFPQRRRGAACERNALTFPPFFFINTSGVVTSLGWA